eukprot:PITA_19096
MQQAFNNKYRDYGRSKDTKDEIFRMTIGHDESLEYYKERFQLSYKRDRCTLDPKSLKLVLHRGVREDILDTLHMLSGGYIYQLPYEDIKIVFRNHSRETRNKGRSSQPMASTLSSNSSIKGEIGNMLEDFKSEMLKTLALQLDTMNIKRKQNEAKRALAVFCPRCTRRHPRNECSLNCIELCYINQRRPPGPRPFQQVLQGSSRAYYNPNQNTATPSWGPPANPSWYTPPPWAYASQYHSQPVISNLQSTTTSVESPTQGWRPQFNNVPALLPPSPTQPQILHFSSLGQPQMPTQPNLNPINRQAQQTYGGETSYPTYVVEIQEINPRSGRILPDNQPPSPHKEVEKKREESNFKANPLFPERLAQPHQPTPKETKLLGELQNLCVKIPLLQAFKDVLIYNKLIKEKCFKHPGRRKMDAPAINFIGQLSNLMLGQEICPKYLEPGSPIVDVHINVTIVPHTLIDLGATINVMTKETMLKLNL